MKGWPDELTSVRLNILFPMLPLTMAVTSAISHGIDVQVHNLNGGMATVPFAHFTPQDALWLLVAEIARRGLSVHYTKQALSNIRLKEGESWETGAWLTMPGQQQRSRTARTSLRRPYWMVLAVGGLYNLLNRAVALCSPQVDQSPFHGHLVSIMTNSRTLLQP